MGQSQLFVHSSRVLVPSLIHLCAAPGVCTTGDLALDVWSTPASAPAAQLLNTVRGSLELILKSPRRYKTDWRSTRSRPHSHSHILSRGPTRRCSRHNVSHIFGVSQIHCTSVLLDSEMLRHADAITHFVSRANQEWTDFEEQRFLGHSCTMWTPTLRLQETGRKRNTRKKNT